MAIQLFENDKDTEDRLVEVAGRHPMRLTKTKLADSIVRRALSMDEDELNQWLVTVPASPAPDQGGGS